MKKLQETIASWCAAHPDTTNYLKKLNDNNVRWAIADNTAVSLFANAKAPTNVTIMVHDDDYKTVTQLTPSGKTMTPFEQDVPTGDGKTLHYQASKLEFMLDKTDIAVIARAQQTVEGHTYDLSLTDLAVQNRIAVGIEGFVYHANPFDTFTIPTVTVYIANPFDVLAAASISQHNKQHKEPTLENIKALVAVGGFAQSYATERAKQLQLDDRAFAFLRKIDAGLQS